MQQISTHQLADWLAKCAASEAGAHPPPVLLDVREPWEYELCQLAGSLLMPMQLLPSRLAELDVASAVVVICHHGMRSMQVAMFLEGRGFGSIYNLAGGIDAWAQDVDPDMRKY
jgi:rhodanese-related sulfurtransferase